MAQLPARDVYGFQLSGAPSAAALSAEWTKARKTASEWKKAEAALAAASSHNPTPLLKPLCRRGIPPELRPRLWLQLSGADARRAAAGPGYYATFASIKGLSRTALLALSDDLASFRHRGHPLFRQQDGMDALRRLLAALHQHNPGAAFRGAASLAGFCLVLLGGLGAEEDAFWLLAALLEDRLYPYCGGRAAYGLRVEAGLLDALVAKKLPKVAAHLARLDTSAAALAGPWFASAFTATLPPESAARVWDALLLEGPKVLHRTALGLLKTFEASITAAGSAGQLRLVLDSRAASLHDADGLMAAAFRVRAMHGAAIATLRAVPAGSAAAQPWEGAPASRPLPT